MERTAQIIKNGYFYLIAGLLIAIYLPALIDLIADWYNDPNYSHGFLIPVISFYLIWRNRDELSKLETKSSSFGLLVIVSAILLFIVGNGASEYFTVRFSFVLLIIGITLYLFGWSLFKKVWFPLLFLIFMIPVPYVIYFSATFPMQLLASKVSAGALNLIGMSVIRQGNIIHLPNQALEVAEACSGMRSLVSLLALGALFSYFFQNRLTPRLIMFLSTVPIAVASNVFRVFTTALIVYTMPDLHVTDEPLHTIMGTLVFVIAFILLFIVGAILRKIFKP